MNKHGWGLRIELAFVLLFIVCILVSTILLHRMHIFGNNDNYDYSGGNYNYGALEASVVNAAKRYYNEKYYGTSSDTIIVNVNTLKNSGYLNPIYDSRNNECNGYAMILNTGTSVAYIRCSNYKTIGYNYDYE